MEHPRLLATVRSGGALLPAGGAPIPLPGAGKLVHLPGRLPVGVDPDTGELELLREVRAGRRSYVPRAVGALREEVHARAGDARDRGERLLDPRHAAGAVHAGDVEGGPIHVRLREGEHPEDTASSP